jgi:hypothetical protein
MDPDATHATNDHVRTIPETTNNNRPSSVTTPHIVGYAANQPNRVTHGPPIITTPAGMDPCCLLIVHAIHVEKTHHHPQGDHHTHHVGDFPQKNVQPPQNGHTATKRARANGTGGVKNTKRTNRRDPANAIFGCASPVFRGLSHMSVSGLSVMSVFLFG